MLAEQQQQDEYQTCVTNDESKTLQNNQIETTKNNRLNSRNIIYNSDAHEMD